MDGRLVLAVAILVLGIGASHAKDFGRHGPMWEIAEPSILETIKNRLADMDKNGEIEAMKEKMQETTRAYVNRPRPVQGLTKATEPRRFSIDLSITVKRDLADHRGRVFARAGTKINPLHYSLFNKRIVVIDGDDPAQVQFSLSEGNEIDTLLVLVNGAPLELMREHKRRFYFDQDAQIVTKFELEHVPSVITRGEDIMIVEEIVVGELN